MKEDINFVVSKKARTWTLSGERNIPNDTSIINERFDGKFERQGTLPPQVDVGAASISQLKFGVFTVAFQLCSPENDRVETKWTEE